MLEAPILAEAVECEDGERFWDKPFEELRMADLQGWLAGFGLSWPLEASPNDVPNILVLLAHSGQQPLLRFLIDVCGVPADATLLPLHISPLICASRFGHDTVIEFLCSRVPPHHVNHQSGAMKLSALGDAAKCGHPSAVATLLKFGADVKLRRTNGLTPLMEAAARGYVECVRVLAAAGSELDARDENGAAAEDLAAANGHEAVAAELRNRIAITCTDDLKLRLP